MNIATIIEFIYFVGNVIVYLVGSLAVLYAILYMFGELLNIIVNYLSFFNLMIDYAWNKKKFMEWLNERKTV